MVIWGLGFGATILGVLIKRILFFLRVYWEGGVGYSKKCLIKPDTAERVGSKDKGLAF